MGFGRVLQQEGPKLKVRTTLVFSGRANTNVRSGDHPEYTSPGSIGLAIASLLELPDDLVPYEFTFRPPVDTRA